MRQIRLFCRDGGYILIPFHICLKNIFIDSQVTFIAQIQINQNGIMAFLFQCAVNIASGNQGYITLGAGSSG